MIHSFSLRSTAKAVLVLISATALVHTVSTQAADKAKDKKSRHLCNWRLSQPQHMF